jgi:hypothetical protein
MPPAVRQDEDLVLDDDYQSDSNVGGLQATPPEDDNVYSSTDDHDRGVEDILNTMEQLESNASNHEDENEDDPESEEEEQRPQRGQREAEQPSQNLDSLRKFWETLPPTLLELSLGNIETPSACLTPRDDDEKRMYSLSKCFKTIPKDSKRHLAQLTDGSSLVFMAQCHTEIPVHIQEVLWFFSNVRNSITDLSNYCLPTTTVTLHKSRISGRGVAGLVTNMEPEPPVRRARPRNTGFVVMADFLGERALHQGKDTKTPVQPIKIHVGFTGATFENQGQEVRETFCFAIITPAGNFDMWGYIYEVFLKQPSRGDKNFKELSEEFKRHSYILRKILRTEAFVNLGMDEHVDGNPETHRFTPSSSLGSITMLNMYQIPCKIFHLVHKKYPESKNLRIMNMPNIQFRHGDENTSKWLKHMNTFINEAARYDVSMRLAMEQYWAAKDKDRSTMVSRAHSLCVPAGADSSLGAAGLSGPLHGGVAAPDRPGYGHDRQARAAAAPAHARIRAGRPGLPLPRVAVQHRGRRRPAGPDARVDSGVPQQDVPARRVSEHHALHDRRAGGESDAVAPEILQQ